MGPYECFTRPPHRVGDGEETESAIWKGRERCSQATGGRGVFLKPASYELEPFLGNHRQGVIRVPFKSKDAGGASKYSNSTGNRGHLGAKREGKRACSEATKLSGRSTESSRPEKRGQGGVFIKRLGSSAENTDAKITRNRMKCVRKTEKTFRAGTLYWARLRKLRAWQKGSRWTAKGTGHHQ